MTERRVDQRYTKVHKPKEVEWRRSAEEMGEILGVTADRVKLDLRQAKRMFKEIWNAGQVEKPVFTRKLTPRPERTHCKHGHEFTKANTYWEKDGHKKCRACILARQAADRRSKGVPTRANRVYKKKAL